MQVNIIDNESYEILYNETSNIVSWHFKKSRFNQKEFHLDIQRILKIVQPNWRIFSDLSRLKYNKLFIDKELVEQVLYILFEFKCVKIAINVNKQSFEMINEIFKDSQDKRVKLFTSVKEALLWINN